MGNFINIVDGQTERNKILNWVANVDADGAFHLQCNKYDILNVGIDGKAHFYPCSLTEYGIATTVVGKDNTIINGE